MLVPIREETPILLFGLICSNFFRGGNMSDKKTILKNLKAMQETDVRTVDLDTLRDIRDVCIDPALPKEERFLSFIRQIGNPYCYRHGNCVVKISFTDSDITLEERIISYLRSKY